MDIDELFFHALSSLPDAVGDLLRAQGDPERFVIASFDGASELGLAILATDLAAERGIDGPSARQDVERMVSSAGQRGEQLVVSLLVDKDLLQRILAASHVDPAIRTAIRDWLEGPLERDHYRVVAIAGDQIRAASVDSDMETEEPPLIPSSMLN
jgi:hypothetical protein